MTFYLKYRPQKLEDIDLVAVRNSLSEIVKSDTLPHAFLFAGPKGTGKTSTARILAKIVNCEAQGTRQKAVEPCNKCEQCISITKGSNIDVIELDAASNRGIDDIRALRDAVKLSPAKAKKKVYIIDEAHMLTVEASNALLKTLEEPPSHVMFILATTNPEKLIETIRSRATFIPFSKAAPEEIMNSLDRVVKGEKIQIKKDALAHIAEASDGSFRDAVKILEQLVSEKKDLEAQKVQEYLSQSKSFKVDDLLTLLAKKDVKGCLELIEKAADGGGSMDSVISGTLKKMRNGLLAKVGVGEEELTDFSKEDLLYLVELFANASRELSDTPIDQLPVEIAIVKWCEKKGSGSQVVRIDETLGSTPTADEANGDTMVQSAEATPGTTQSQSPLSIAENGVDAQVWQRILTDIKPINASIEALLRAARPLGYDGKMLTLGVFYKFHKERLEEVAQKRILEEVVSKVLGSQTRITCVLTDPPPRKINTAVPTETVLTEGKDKDIIDIAEEIFSN